MSFKNIGFILLLILHAFSLWSQESKEPISPKDVAPDKVYFGGSLGLPNLLNLHCGYTVGNLYMGLTLPVLSLFKAPPKPSGEIDQSQPGGYGAFQLNLGPALVWDWGLVAFSAVAALGGSTDIEGNTSPYGYLGAALDLKLFLFWAEAGLGYGWSSKGQGFGPLVQLGIMF